MELLFFIRGFRYLVLALISAAFAWSVSGLLSSYLDIDIIRSMLSVAALTAVASQWYFVERFRPLTLIVPTMLATSLLLSVLSAHYMYLVCRITIIYS